MGRRLKVVAPIEPTPPPPTKMQIIGEKLGDMALWGFMWLMMAVCGFGWVSNIMIIAAKFHSDITTEIVLRIIGVVVFPLGIILGYVPAF